MEERDDKCVSIQETIYGTKTLARLEAIKEAVDPNYIFDCFGCIGNNRKKETETKDEETTSGETDTKEEEKTSGETDTEWIDPCCCLERWSFLDLVEIGLSVTRLDSS